MEINSDDLKLTDCGVLVNTANNFRLQNKRLFLTYPTQLPKREFFEWFITNVGELKYYKISHETYEELDTDGNEAFHTHCLFEFANKPNIRSATYMDYMDYHPNIKRVASNFHFSNAIRYLDKEDTAPFGNIKITDFDKDDRLDEVYDKIQKHKKWKDVINDSTIRKMVSVKLNWVKEIWASKPRSKIVAPIKFQELMDWQKDLYKHLKNAPVPREVIWVWSKGPKTGKTTFKMFLQSKLDVLPIDLQSSRLNMSDIVNIYDDESIIVFDLPMSKSKSLQKRLEDTLDEEGNVVEPTSHTLLDTLENLSNKGQEFTSLKYMGRKCAINAHILVFSNCSPTLIDSYIPKRLKVIEAKLKNST